MVRIGTLASVSSLAAGTWGVYAFTSACRSGCIPHSMTAPDAGPLGALFPLLSLALVVIGLAGFVGPRRVYYASIGGAALVDLMEGVSYSDMDPAYFYATVALATLCLLLSLAAVRAQTGVSEQSNPMNLPVFG